MGGVARNYVLLPLTIIVDAANVMGSRPDGWWRDRAGAATRLMNQLAELAAKGVTSLPDSVDVPELERWFPVYVVVLEGASAAAPDPVQPRLGDCEWSGLQGQVMTRLPGWLATCPSLRW